MKKNRLFKYLAIWLFALCFTSSCNMYLPTSNVISNQKRPAIIFADHESKAIIYVDGIEIGKVANYSDKALLLESGTHQIKIVENDRILFNKKIFISGEEIRKINLK